MRESLTITDIRRELRLYEERYGVPSDRLVTAFQTDGVLVETGDFLRWSFLYRVATRWEVGR